MSKETFSIVDENDDPLYNVRGKELLHRIKSPHRAVHVLIETFRSGFVIQRKAEGTENAGKLSSAASGHVRAGETYEEAAIRETKEELGLEIDKSELKFVVKLPPSEDTDNEFVCVYSYLMDLKERICPDEAEVESVILMKLEDLIDHIKKSPNEYSPAFLLAFNAWV